MSKVKVIKKAGTAKKKNKKPGALKGKKTRISGKVVKQGETYIPHMSELMDLDDIKQEAVGGRGSIEIDDDI